MIFLQMAAVALLVTMGLSLIRAVKGPTVFDRIQAVNMFATKTVMMIAVLGFISDDAVNYLDIALMYAIIGFIGTVAVLKLTEYGGLGRLRPMTARQIDEARREQETEGQ